MKRSIFFPTLIDNPFFLFSKGFEGFQGTPKDFKEFDKLLSDFRDIKGF